MLKKILAIILIVTILVVQMDQYKKQAEAFFAIPIVLAAEELEALLCLVAAGTVVHSIPAATDMAKKYARVRTPAIHFDANGILNLTAEAINNARTWIDSTYNSMPTTVVSDSGTTGYGTTFLGTYPYNATPITHTFFEHADLGSLDTKRIELLNFNRLTDWMTYYDNLESNLELTFPSTLDYVKVNFTAFQAYITWNIGGVSGSRLYDQFPSNYIGLVDRFRLDITTTLDETGKKVITILPRFHNLGYEESNWSDDSFAPNISIPNTDCFGTLTLEARPMDPMSLNIDTITTYPKADISEIAAPTTFPISVTMPTTWDQVITDDTTAPPDPVEEPTSILDFLAKLLAAILAIPHLIAEAIATTFTAEKTGDAIDFTKLKFAANLFTNKFPFSLPWDLQAMVTTFGSGTTVAPVIPIGIGTMETNIDLSRFNSLAAAARVLELFAFGVGLLFGTRKLLGGAS